MLIFSFIAFTPDRDYAHSSSKLFKRHKTISLMVFNNIENNECNGKRETRNLRRVTMNVTFNQSIM